MDRIRHDHRAGDQRLHQSEVAFPVIPLRHDDDLVPHESVDILFGHRSSPDLAAAAHQSRRAGYVTAVLGEDETSDRFGDAISQLPVLVVRFDVPKVRNIFVPNIIIIVVVASWSSDGGRILPPPLLQTVADPSSEGFSNGKVDLGNAAVVNVVGEWEVRIIPRPTVQIEEGSIVVVVVILLRRRQQQRGASRSDHAEATVIPVHDQISNRQVLVPPPDQGSDPPGARRPVVGTGISPIDDEQFRIRQTFRLPILYPPDQAIAFAVFVFVFVFAAAVRVVSNAVATFGTLVTARSDTVDTLGQVWPTMLPT